MVNAEHGIDILPVESNTILVALTHLALVQDTLSGPFGLESRAVDRDAALGLVKLKLLTPDEIARRTGARSKPLAEVCVAHGQSPAEPPSRTDDYYDVGLCSCGNCEGISTRGFSGGTRPWARTALWPRQIEGGVIIREGTPPDVPSSDKLPQWLTNGPTGPVPAAGVVVGLADTVFAPQAWMDGAWVARYSDRLWGPPPHVAKRPRDLPCRSDPSVRPPGATIDARRVP